MLFIYLWFWGRISLCWPWIGYPPASVSWVLGPDFKSIRLLMWSIFIWRTDEGFQVTYHNALCFILIILCVMDQTRALQILGKSYSQLLISLSVCMSLSPSLPPPSLLPTPELGIAHLSLLPLEFYAYLKPYSLVSGNRFKIPMNLPLTLKNLSFFEIVLTSLWVLWDSWRYFFAI